MSFAIRYSPFAFRGSRFSRSGSSYSEPSQFRRWGRSTNPSRVVVVSIFSVKNSSWTEFGVASLFGRPDAPRKTFPGHGTGFAVVRVWLLVRCESRFVPARWRDGLSEERTVVCLQQHHGQPKASVQPARHQVALGPSTAACRRSWEPARPASVARPAPPDSSGSGTAPSVIRCGPGPCILPHSAPYPCGSGIRRFRDSP